MDEKLARVLHGFVELTPTQQGQFLDELRRYREARTEPEKKTIREHFEKGAHVKLGPVSEGCPCCGR